MSKISASLRPRLRTKPKALPKSWPFDDRVLVWLLPNLLPDVARLHKSDGPSLREIFPEQALESLDIALTRMIKGDSRS
jgi:hypothetical protein